ncbi:uncharacterized protein LOC144031785 [Festucalex cinctus]
MSYAQRGSGRKGKRFIQHDAASWTPPAGHHENCMVLCSPHTGCVKHTLTRGGLISAVVVRLVVVSCSAKMEAGRRQQADFFYRPESNCGHFNTPNESVQRAVPCDTCQLLAGRLIACDLQ